MQNQDPERHQQPQRQHERQHERQPQPQNEPERQREREREREERENEHGDIWYLSRTPYCKHRGPCIISILKSTPKIALITYLIKAGLSILFSLKKIFKKPTQLFTLLLGKDAIRFGLFVGSFVGLFRSILCSLRRVVDEQRQKYIPLLAGLVGGLLSVLFLAKQTRQSIGLFLMARAIDITYQSLVKKGYLPEFKYFYVVLYALMMGISGYAYGTEPGSMSAQMNKFYLTFTNETLSDMQMRQIWIQRKNNYLARYGIPRQDPLDYMPKLKKYYEGLKVSGSGSAK